MTTGDDVASQVSPAVLAVAEHVAARLDTDATVDGNTAARFVALLQAGSVPDADDLAAALYETSGKVDE